MNPIYKQFLLALCLATSTFAASNMDEDSTPPALSPLSTSVVVEETSEFGDSSYISQEMTTAGAASLLASHEDQTVTDLKSGLVNSPFRLLSNEVMLEIFRQIPFTHPQQILNLALTCKWFNELLNHPSSIRYVDFSRYSSYRGLPLIPILGTTGILARQRHLFHLTSHGHTFWKHMLPKQKNLRILHIEFCDVSDSDICDFLPPLNELTELKFENSKLKGKAQIALPKSLESLPNLRTLNLAITNFNNEGTIALAGAFQFLPNLTSLDIPTVMLFNHEGSKIAVAESLKNLKNLTALDLEGNGITDAVARALADSLQSLTNLRTLNLSRNDIGDEGATTLAGAFTFLLNLTKLDLGRNNIGNDGIMALAPTLPTLTRLIELDLSLGRYGDEEYEDEDPEVTKFDANELPINNQGALVLAEAFAALPNLRTIALNNHTIRDEGATALAQAVRFHTQLSEIYLYKNEISDTGAKAFAEALTINNIFKELNLAENCISAEGMEALNRCVSESNGRIKIWLGGNPGNDGEFADEQSEESEYSDMGEA